MKQLTIIFIISLSFAQKGVEPIPKESTWRRSLSRVLGFEDRTYNVHNDGKLALYFSNYGLLGFYNPSLEYPVNTQRYYIWQLGLMIGAKVDTSDNGIDDPVPLVSDTYQDQGEANFNPIAGYHSIGLNPLAAVSNNPVTWPTVWPGDLETVKGDDYGPDFIFKYLTAFGLIFQIDWKLHATTFFDPFCHQMVPVEQYVSMSRKQFYRYRYEEPESIIWIERRVAGESVRAFSNRILRPASLPSFRDCRSKPAARPGSRCTPRPASWSIASLAIASPLPRLVASPNQ